MATEQHQRTITQALITSRLNYRNSLYAGINKQLTKRLQTIQNTAARLILNLPCQSHITLYLRELHLFPINNHSQGSSLTHLRSARIPSRVIVRYTNTYNTTGMTPPTLFIITIKQLFRRLTIRTSCKISCFFRHSITSPLTHQSPAVENDHPCVVIPQIFAFLTPIFVLN